MSGNTSRTEYQELKAFLDFFSTRYTEIERLPPEWRPMACLEKLEKKSKRMALQGLKQAVHDIVSEIPHFDPEKFKEIDAELSERNLISLSDLMRRFSKEAARIVKRGKINNETEYFLIRNMRDDSFPVDEDKIDVLDRLIADFEEKAAKP